MNSCQTHRTTTLQTQNNQPTPTLTQPQKTKHTSVATNCETTNSSCNDPKQPFSDVDIANQKQFNKERNLSYFQISASSALKRNHHM